MLVVCSLTIHIIIHMQQLQSYVTATILNPLWLYDSKEMTASDLEWLFEGSSPAPRLLKAI